MHLKKLELNGFKSFAHRSEFVFDVPIIAIVGPNGSGKSNVVEAIRFVLGEQSVKSMRGKTGSDLIFKGSKDIPKMSRASVSITFDNSDRVFAISQSDNSSINVDFDEITISRQVFVDGASVYKINGTEVRMKDVHELIASINIGSSGHHIISQGEADRYLNANAKDRRTLIEEALGLKVYQYRLNESQRKLQRCQDNLRETELLRREIAPHLRFLKRQVEKIEKAKQLRIDLLNLYQTYFQQEDFLIDKINQGLSQQFQQLKEEQQQVDEFLSTHESVKHKSFEEEAQIAQLQEELSSYQQQRQELIRESGRIEGMVSVLEQSPQVAQPTEEKSYPLSEIKQFCNRIIKQINDVAATDSKSVSTFLSSLKEELAELLDSKKPEKTQDQHSETLDKRKGELAEIQKQIKQVSQKEEQTSADISRLHKQLAQKRNQEQEQQKAYYEILSQKKELDTRAQHIDDKKQSLAHRVEDRDREYQEALVLLSIDSIAIPPQGTEQESEITAESQTPLRRELERTKIRLEEMGGGSGIELIKEYEETLERDQFLEKETSDVQETMTSLENIIANLTTTLNVEFNKGVTKINTQFDHFFKLMFGGGKAQLQEIAITKRKVKSQEDDQEQPSNEEESDTEYGIDIAVQLPRKKVSDLDMLSGGERSLTSIALLFALSQVNPPPFLVLDETDAALDEANSQKYGDMIESLSKFSQLILVTHNRETMSRTHTLFGVTLGRDDASKMLSLRLEDAEQYAK